MYPTDLLHPSPAPHFKSFQVFLISCPKRPSFRIWNTNTRVWESQINNVRKRNSWQPCRKYCLSPSGDLVTRVVSGRINTVHSEGSLYLDHILITFLLNTADVKTYSFTQSLQQQQWRFCVLRVRTAARMQVLRQAGSSLKTWITVSLPHLVRSRHPPLLDALKEKEGWGVHRYKGWISDCVCTWDCYGV
jgi:hypothetical protein